MALLEGNLRARYAEDREYLERLMDLEVTLGGFASALYSDDPEVMVDVLGRSHQVEPTRLIADRRRTNAARCRVLFED
jgi:hypothetical protein